MWDKFILTESLKDMKKQGNLKKKMLYIESAMKTLFYGKKYATFAIIATLQLIYNYYGTIITKNKEFKK